MVISAAHFKDITNGYEKRTDGLWTHTGKLVVKGGPVDLPDGSIGTSEIAGDAVQKYLGGFFQSTSWNSGIAGTWQETTVSVSVAATGGLLRIEAGCNIYNNTATAYTMFGIGWNSAVQYGLGAIHHPFANQQVPIYFTFYTQPPPLTYRYAIYLNASAGVSSIWNGSLAYLHVTEQKR